MAPDLGRVDHNFGWTLRGSERNARDAGNTFSARAGADPGATDTKTLAAFSVGNPPEVSPVMARSHSHAVKIGEGRQARRRKRQKKQTRAASSWFIAWVCNDPECVVPVHST